MIPLIHPPSHSTESTLTMAQREVECKDAASPLFRINNVVADKCHTDSNAVDRRDGDHDHIDTKVHVIRGGHNGEYD